MLYAVLNARVYILCLFQLTCYVHAALVAAHQALVNAYLGRTETFPAKDVLGSVCLQFLDAGGGPAGKNITVGAFRCLP